ncbi:MAG TPA: type II secretion system protein GspE, partial [Leptospiraceae bacterium]|nr:type II secretion system protein GspE [Leptospiraceae bacterium]
GCENCVGTGYRGRTGLYELMLMDEDVQRIVIRGGDSEAVKKVALEKGMQTLQTYGKNKVLDGVTTIEEVLRVT